MSGRSVHRRDTYPWDSPRVSVGRRFASTQPVFNNTQELAQTGAVSATLFVVFIAFVTWHASRRASTRTAVGIVQQLRRSGSYSLRVEATQLVWNPAMPIGTGNRLPGPAEAHYSIDPNDLVHLILISKSGRRQQFSGPIPDHLLDEARIRRLACLRAHAVSVYVASLVAGFALGFVLSHGGWANRMLFGYLAGLATITLWAIGLRVVHVGHALRHLND
jgi:hypothetical protein